MNAGTLYVILPRIITQSIHDFRNFFDLSEDAYPSLGAGGVTAHPLQRVLQYGAGYSSFRGTCRLRYLVNGC